jgi:hypothetical protein
VHNPQLRAKAREIIDRIGPRLAHEIWREMEATRKRERDAAWKSEYAEWKSSR